MSLVGGMAKLAPCRYEEATQSVNRQPTAKRMSADRQTAFPTVLAVSPGCQQ